MSRRPGADEILLRAVGGPEQGRSWTFSRSRIRVGRDAGCELVLEDPTVSRRHAELRKVGDAYRLHDVSAANPTLLNGAPGSGRMVADADRIKIGETELRVGLARSSTPSADGSRTLVLALLLLVAVGVVAMIVIGSGATSTDDPPSTPAPAVADAAGASSEGEEEPGGATSRPVPREARGLYELGKTAYHYGRLRDARRHLQVALQLTRGDFPDAERFLRLTEVKIETRAEGLLERARGDLAALRIESAERALAEVMLLVQETDPRHQEASRLMASMSDRRE